MKQKLVLAFVLIFTIKSFAQDSKFSIEASYPIPSDNNFIGENYTGLVDVGINYRFLEFASVNIGASIHMGILKNTKSSIPDIDIVAHIIQPVLFAELDLETMDKFHPALGLGYAFIIFDASGTLMGEEIHHIDETLTTDGLHINLGALYEISDKWYVKAQYNFIKARPEGEALDIKYNKNINILKIGLGYRL